ncbi:MAG TPA: nucleoside monophosphate kinase [Candidatus Brocadiia bacterium]|nr:nucleoside monophosphate kinase [Candidatus Brocadiia bacterium]
MTPRALLLIGPTGAGKSPQGMLLEKAGAGLHFDFGHELRQSVADPAAAPFPPRDAEFVRSLIQSCALLPHDRFDIALAVLRAFMKRRAFDPAAQRLILNGLPRHEAQARDLAPHVHVDKVAVLEAAASVLAQRVERRRAGLTLDHAGRDDDHAAAIAAKLRVYEAQTRPLIAFYASQPGVEILRLTVDGTTTDATLHAALLDFCSNR